MKINSIELKNKKHNINITFDNNDNEKKFLVKLIMMFVEKYQINCLLTDLDVRYEDYLTYFRKENCYTLDVFTEGKIFAYNLNFGEILDVISSWGCFTIDAAIGIGSPDLYLIEKKEYSYEHLKKMPIYIQQVLDNSIIIICDEICYEQIKEILLN